MPQTAICSILSSTRAVLIPNNLIILWLFTLHAQVFDLDGGVLGADSWFLSPKRPAGSLARDSDAYQSFSHDLHILHQHPPPHPLLPPTRSLALERAREMGLLISARIRGCMIAPALI